MTTAAVPTNDPFALAGEAGAALRKGLGVDEHAFVVILGSGWAAAADDLGETVAEVELAQIPGFHEPQVEGHRDWARSVDVDGQAVLVLGGRVHLYEGFTASEVVHGVRAAYATGCRHVIVTNAAGAINPNLTVGRPVLLCDQINLTGTSSMAGEAPPTHLPGRFCDMTDAYCSNLREVARSVDPTIDEGVYAGMFGGAYETPAEVKMLAALGADLVGMSTVLEAIAARHLGMGVLGISLVTNMAAGITDKKLAHSEVLEAAAEANESIVRLIRNVIVQR